MKHSKFTVKKHLTVIIFFVLILSSMLIYEGLFSLQEKSPEPGTPETDIPMERGNGDAVTGPEEVREPAVAYSRSNEKINGIKQVINILEIDISDSRVRVRPELSHGVFFGYEKLSEMAERLNPYALVNGGFFHEYAMPGGMVQIDGKLLKSSTGQYPVLIIDKNEVWLEEIETELWVEVNGRAVPIDGVNDFSAAGTAVLYTPEFGSTNRARYGNTTVIVEEGRVTGVRHSEDRTAIPNKGFLLTFYKPHEADEALFMIGAEVDFKYKPDLGSSGQAYECGPWIIKKGEILEKSYDPWIGTLENRDPRTAVGIRDDGRLLLITVDGRQPGYSEGMTFRELAAFLAGLRVTDAAMLDGGASTEMIVEGEIVNRPSDGGRERPLGGAIAVFYDAGG